MKKQTNKYIFLTINHTTTDTEGLSVDREVQGCSKRERGGITAEQERVDERGPRSGPNGSHGRGFVKNGNGDRSLAGVGRGRGQAGRGDRAQGKGRAGM